MSLLISIVLYCYLILISINLYQELIHSLLILLQKTNFFLLFETFD